MKVSVVQLCSGDDPGANLPITLDLIKNAAAQGAKLVATPEVTNCVSQSRERQRSVLKTEAEDQTLSALRACASDLGIYLAIGSLALAGDDPDERFVNRSFLVGLDGRIAARYDKMHMFDVRVSETEQYLESSGYRPGDTAVIAKVGETTLGLTVCYDVRFAYLYRALAQAGAEILMVPSAFSPVTGVAHWEPLLRARAIETGSFVIAAAQCGTHQASYGKVRKTYGHSMIVAPWGEVLLDAGTEPGSHVVDLDLREVAQARQRIPALQHDRDFKGP